MPVTKQVKFTEEELRAVHRELFHAAWQPKPFYDARRAALRKLDDHFGADRAHLVLQQPAKEGP